MDEVTAEVGVLQRLQVSQSRRTPYVFSEEDQETVDIALIGGVSI